MAHGEHVTHVFNGSRERARVLVCRSEFLLGQMLRHPICRACGISKEQCVMLTFAQLAYIQRPRGAPLNHPP